MPDKNLLVIRRMAVMVTLKFCASLDRVCPDVFMTVVVMPMQIVLMKFLCLFFICVVLLLGACGFRFGLFFVDGWWLYVATILWGLCAVPKKRVFGPKTAKIMKIALFWP